MRVIRVKALFTILVVWLVLDIVGQQTGLTSFTIGELFDKYYWTWGLAVLASLLVSETV